MSIELCSCVKSDVGPLLRDVLQVFSAAAGNEPNCYLNLAQYGNLQRRFGKPQILLIVSLLEKLEYMAAAR